MKAWVSKLTFDTENLTKREKPKRKLEKLGPGVRGIKEADQFVVLFLNLDGKLRQERISASGKDGKKRAGLVDQADQSAKRGDCQVALWITRKRYDVRRRTLCLASQVGSESVEPDSHATLYRCRVCRHPPIGRQTDCRDDR